MSKIEKNIRKIRQIKNISQCRMAKGLNVSQATYSKMESGSVIISDQRLKVIAKLLKVDKETIKDFDVNLGLNTTGKNVNKKKVSQKNVTKIEDGYKEKIALLSEQSRLLKEQNIILSYQLKVMQEQYQH